MYTWSLKLFNLSSLGSSNLYTLHNRYAKRVNFWMKRYENFVGLTEVKAAQGKVVQMEKAFVETQDLRRELQMKVRCVDYLIQEYSGDRLPGLG